MLSGIGSTLGILCCSLLGCEKGSGQDDHGLYDHEQRYSLACAYSFSCSTPSNLCRFLLMCRTHRAAAVVPEGIPAAAVEPEPEPEPEPKPKDAHAQLINDVQLAHGIQESLAQPGLPNDDADDESGSPAAVREEQSEDTLRAAARSEAGEDSEDSDDSFGFGSPSSTADEPVRRRQTAGPRDVD
jgi:hypothetical protein